MSDRDTGDLPYELGRDKIVLRVRASPRAASARAGGLHRGADGRVSLLVKVTAPPEKGKANKAVIDTLARALGLAKSRFTITAGEADRNKTVVITGDPAKAAGAINSLVHARQED